jgi:DNA-directed RNA polymerase specialized sigma subunit
VNAKEYLSRALWLDQRINNKLEQLEMLRTLAEKMGANLTEEKVSGGSNTKSHMENTVVKIVDLEKEIKEDIDRLIAIKAETMDTISQVYDPISQIILEMRYINGKSWDEISRDLNYKDSSVFKMHSRALKEIAKIQKRAVKYSKVE